MAARFARAHQETSARARGLHPWQFAPVAARFARAHQETSARARRRRVKFFAQLSRKKAGRVWDSVPRSWWRQQAQERLKCPGGTFLGGGPSPGVLRAARGGRDSRTELPVTPPQACTALWYKRRRGDTGLCGALAGCPLRPPQGGTSPKGGGETRLSANPWWAAYSAPPLGELARRQP